MQEHTTGLILRIRPLTETSLIILWLTPDLGRIATVAKGARRPKSPFAGKLDLFYEADFSFQRSRRSELHTLREVVLRETNEMLRKEIVFLQQASYGAALIEQTTETETPLENVFPLLKSFLSHLVLRPPRSASVFAFEMKLLNELGLKPNLDDAKLSAGAKQILDRLIKLDWPDLDRLKLSETQTTEIAQFLHGFLIFHLGKIPKGRNRSLAPSS
ncbi:MAG: DNA repair protein RecO [Verrucomicrobiota bacterium]